MVERMRIELTTRCLQGSVATLGTCLPTLKMMSVEGFYPTSSICPRITGTQRSARRGICSSEKLEHMKGIEPSASTLATSRSTTELHVHLTHRSDRPYGQSLGPRACKLTVGSALLPMCRKNTSKCRRGCFWRSTN